MTRRIRTRHYLSGLGDGNVRKRQQEGSDGMLLTDDLFRRPFFDRTTTQQHVRKRPSDLLLFESSSSRDNTTMSQQQGPWQVSAMALVCVLGLLLALFLQLVTDNNEQQQQPQKVTYLRTKQVKKKKKTDEWTKDEPAAATAFQAEEDASAAALYYPPRYQQQQHRQRKISGSGLLEVSNNNNNLASKSPVIINSRPYYHHTDVSSGNTNNNIMAGFSPSCSKSPPLHRGVALPLANSSGLEGFETKSPKPSPSLVRGTLSPVSSFCSLPTDDDPDERNSTNAGPRLSYKSSSSCSPQPQQQVFSSSLSFSPGGNQDFVTPKATGRQRRSVALSSVLSPQQTMEAPELPFIPNLFNNESNSDHRKDHDDDDDLEIQRMESGDMTYSPQCIKQNNDALLSEASRIAAAASPGPRNNIVHTRKDLTLATDAASSLTSSIRFDELQLMRVIGGGGFGQVWQAAWRGTPVAVKVASAQVELKTILEEFAAEINMLKGMRHPNICLYMGACLDPPNRAIVTELAANGSLWDALRLPLQAPFEACEFDSGSVDTLHKCWPGARGFPPRGTWPWMLVKRVACGAARGMTYLHSGTPPVLHRDLKSANLLLDDAYTTKVCDFGLSRLKAHQNSGSGSMTGNCGTVQWMAPEVLANQHYAEPADVYSFGIILWELLTGECPYDGMSAIQCALAVLNKNHRPTIPEWCPVALAALIEACLEQDPSKRPTFGQVLLALDAMP